MASAAGLIYRWPRGAGALDDAGARGDRRRHTALHRVSDSSQRLTDAGIPADRLLMTVTLGWAAAILCAGIAGSLLRAPVPPYADLVLMPAEPSMAVQEVRAGGQGAASSERARE